MELIIAAHGAVTCPAAWWGSCDGLAASIDSTFLASLSARHARRAWTLICTNAHVLTTDRNRSQSIATDRPIARSR